MILVLLIFCLAVGINTRYNLIICPIILVAILILLIIKKRKILTILALVTFFIGVGVSFIHIETNSTTFTGYVAEAKDNYYLFKANWSEYYVYDKDHSYEVGDFLTIEGSKKELSFTTLESDFDFTKYLNKKGVYYQLYVSNVKVNFSNPIRIRQIQDDFLSNFDSETASVVGSILFSRYEDTNSYSILSSLHLSRFLSSSGIYIMFFLKILNTLLSRFLKEKWSKLISFIFLSGYLVFTFPRFTVLRISLIYLLRWINDYLLKNKHSYFYILGISAVIFLLFDYHNALQDSFILGYLIPLYINIVNNSIIHIEGIKKKLLVNFLTYLFFIPFEISYYSEINVLSFPLQYVFTPIFLLIGTSSLLCFIKIPIYALPTKLTSFLLTIANPISNLNTAIYMKEFNPILTVVYYSLLILLIYLFSIRLKPLMKVSVPIFMLYGLLNMIPISNFISSEVCFINVGQGDSCLIRIKSTAILIDTGGLTYKDVATDCLIPFFKKKQIYSIDKVIITHNDNDHMGALESLTNNFYVKDVITSTTSFPLTVNGITFNNYNNYANNSTDENESSLVIGFKLNKLNYLCMGDAPKSIEKQIIADYSSIPCDILKIGHHGSNTSTSDEFIKFLKPKEAVISVGKNNYGHPTDTVLNILKKNNVTIKRTDLDGTIVYN